MAWTSVSQSKQQRINKSFYPSKYYHYHYHHHILNLSFYERSLFTFPQSKICFRCPHAFHHYTTHRTTFPSHPSSISPLLIHPPQNFLLQPLASLDLALGGSCATCRWVGVTQAFGGVFVAFGFGLKHFPFLDNCIAF